MFNAILKWIIGYIYLSITGDGKERFINICKKNNIHFLNLSVKESSYDAILLTKDYKLLSPFIKKTGIDIQITNKKGLPHLFYKYKKRKIFVLCMICFILLIYSFSFFIWNINIEGTNNYTEEQIIKHVRDNYVNTGTPIKNIDCNALEKSLRNDFEDLAWISCEIKGTRLNICLMETIEDEKVHQITEPCNIVACKDGIITDILVSNGTKVVKPGDEIKKNDILITGVVNVYNEYDELLETNYVSAKGSIIALVSYEYSDEFELSSTQKKYTGETKNNYQLCLFNSFLPYYKSKIKYETYDTIKEDKNIKIGDSFYLPGFLRVTSYKEYTVETITLSEKEAREKAQNRLNIYIDNLKKKGVSILENNVKITFENGRCKAEGNLLVKESIGVPAELEIIGQGEEP